MTAVYWIAVVCASYYLVAFAYYLVAFVLSLAASRSRVRQGRHEDFESIWRSGLTLPVSVIVLARGKAAGIVDCVKSLVKLDYPEHEVIVVTDGSRGEALRQLDREFSLTARDVHYRRSLETARPRRIYRSRREPMLTVVDKEGGGRADACNTGVNLARYPYVCACHGGTVFERDAMLRTMRAILRDPEGIVGVGSLSSVGNDVSVRDGEIVECRAPARLLVRLQALDHIRAFVIHRQAWRSHGFMLEAMGAFSVWRREVVVEAGGFGSAIAGEDVELAFRVYEQMKRSEAKGRVVSLPDPVCWAEAPGTWRGLWRQRRDQQRAVTGSFFRHIGMFLNPRYGAVGIVGMPYYLFAKVLAPFFDVAATTAIPIAWLGGAVSVTGFAAMAGIVALVSASRSVSGVLVHDAGYRIYSYRDVAKLLAAGFVEWLGYRQVVSLARIAGMLGTGGGAGR